MKNTVKTPKPASFFRQILDAPNAPLAWEVLHESASWWRDMEICPQDTIHHGEGDAATHTRMVWDALSDIPEYGDLPTNAQGVLRVAALLHDIGKPATTREEGGRITARGHAKWGETMARRLLWEAGDIAFGIRETVCALIRYHQHPFWIIERDPKRALRDLLAISVSHTRCDYLSLLAIADAKGRVCEDGESLLLNVQLFAEMARENNCLSGPYPFASSFSRVAYFQTEGRDPSYAAHDTLEGEMIVLSGLPGSGKDTYIKNQLSGLPVVSLDAVRGEMGVSPRDNQEPVLYAAREKARRFLRNKEAFVWNATNLSRELRQRPVSLATDYRARVQIVYVESPARDLFTQNLSRPNAVPQNVMGRMMHKWEIPDGSEAHDLVWAVRE